MRASHHSVIRPNPPGWALSRASVRAQPPSFRSNPTRPMKSLAFLVLTATVTIAAPIKPIPLAGAWRFALDPQDLGLEAGPDNWRFPDTHRAPRLPQAQGFGEKPSMDTQWTGEGWRYPEMFQEGQSAGRLQVPLHPPAAPPLRRPGVVPARHRDPRRLGRASTSPSTSSAPTGRPPPGSTAGSSAARDSLGTPHEFDLGPPAPGRHVLTLRIDNRLSPVNLGPAQPPCHRRHPGQLERRGRPHRIARRPGRPHHACRGAARSRPPARSASGCTPPAREGSAKATIVVGGPLRSAPARTSRDSAAGQRRVIGSGHGLHPRHSRRPAVGRVPSASLRARHPPRPPRGPPHRDAARSASATSATPTAASPSTAARPSSAARSSAASSRCTGHPPTDVDSWKRIIRICKAHGLNHMRFHSWCPPEAAFAAADELGFYLQPEVSSWANGSAQIGSGRPLDAWIDAETERMLRAYGHHPSFVMLAYGNEPAGPNHKQVAAGLGRPLEGAGPAAPLHHRRRLAGHARVRLAFVARTRASRAGARASAPSSTPSRRAPTSTGREEHRRRFPPGADHLPRDRPVVRLPGLQRDRQIHRLLQGAELRDSSATTARRNGLLDQAADFLQASGKLPGSSPTSTTSRPPCAPPASAASNSSTSTTSPARAPRWSACSMPSGTRRATHPGGIPPLLRPRRAARADRRRWSSRTDEAFEADLQLAHFGPGRPHGATPELDPQPQRARSSPRACCPARDCATGDLHDLGRIRVPLADVPAPAKLTLTVGAIRPGLEQPLGPLRLPRERANPKRSLRPSSSTVRFPTPSPRSPPAGSVLWLAPPDRIRNDPEHPLKIGFSPIFWNTAWTNWQPPHTLGLLGRPGAPGLRLLPDRCPLQLAVVGDRHAAPAPSS